MKNLIMTFAAAVGLSLGSFAQSATAESKAFHSSQIVAPYDIEVTYNKTVHVLFPAAVQYVDLGSNDIIAGRASGAENVVRIKSAVAGFPGETNFSVITADGCESRTNSRSLAYSAVGFLRSQSSISTDSWPGSSA